MINRKPSNRYLKDEFEDALPNFSKSAYHDHKRINASFRDLEDSPCKQTYERFNKIFRSY